MKFSIRGTSGLDYGSAVGNLQGATITVEGTPYKLTDMLPLCSNLQVNAFQDGPTFTVEFLVETNFGIQAITGAGTQLRQIDANGEIIFSGFLLSAVLGQFNGGKGYLVPSKGHIDLPTLIGTPTIPIANDNNGIVFFPCSTGLFLCEKTVNPLFNSSVENCIQFSIDINAYNRFVSAKELRAETNNKAFLFNNIGNRP